MEKELAARGTHASLSQRTRTHRNIWAPMFKDAQKKKKEEKKMAPFASRYNQAVSRLGAR